MKILFIRPPRYMWPFNSESSSFWQPLGFASMAAVLRENGFQSEIIDCLPLKLGWKSLKRKLAAKNFDILCVGDETASAHESIKLTQLTKHIKPDVKTIAGGYFLPYLEEHALNKWGIDFLIRGEGEQTILELLSFLDGRKKVSLKYYGKNKSKKIISLKDIDGLIYKDKKIKINPERKPLILDKLPLPAYDLLPMHLYGKDSTNHKDFAAIEHGRGCTGNCAFCSINSLYSYKNKACYRTKSPKKSFQETELLVKKYNRKTLNWADGSFNLDPEWNKKYFQLLEDNNIHLQHTGWLRADCIVRDEKKGIMKKMVDNGLVQAIIGMERLWERDHQKIHTLHKKYEICEKAFKILKKYKKVFTITTFIYGLPDDNKKELRKIRTFIYKNIVDFQFILPYTPYPGTRLWKKYKEDFNIEDFKSWNLHRPVMGTKHLSRKQLDNWFKSCLLLYPFHSTFYIRNLFEKNKRKRRVQRSLSKKVLKGLFRGIKGELIGQKNLKYGRKPKWYNT